VTALFRKISKLAKGQGILEFALILPLLLALLIGVIETGRLLFIYSAANSASREAARYGAAIGLSENGIERFRDCAAMKATAERIGSLAGIRDDQIEIKYDHGPEDPTPWESLAACPSTVDRGDRIVVRVQADYSPILPLGQFANFTITSDNARTIIKDVPVGTAILPLVNTATNTATATNTETPTQTPTSTQTPVPTDTPTPTASPTVTQTPTDTRTPTVTLTATPGPSSTPTSTATETPTSTSTATATSTNTPTPTLTPTPVCNGIILSFSAPSAKKLELQIQNGQMGTIRVEQMIFYWPDAANLNKTLMQIYMNSNQVWNGNDGSSPTIIYSNQWIPGTDEIRQVAGDSLGIMQFFFEKDAENSPYEISITFDNGCTKNTQR
jgi:hypothetical protein